MAHYSNIFRKAKEMDVSRSFAADARLRYLQPRLDGYNLAYKKKGISPETAVAVHTWRMEIIEEIEYLKKYRDYVPDESTTLTDDQIQQARDYPVDRLIDFNQFGKSLAWCHADKSPSLSHWKGGNKASCFVCNKKFDSIAIVMHKYGMNFVDAVRELI